MKSFLLLCFLGILVVYIVGVSAQAPGVGGGAGAGGGAGVGAGTGMGIKTPFGDAGIGGSAGAGANAGAGGNAGAGSHGGPPVQRSKRDILREHFVAAMKGHHGGKRRGSAQNPPSDGNKNPTQGEPTNDPKK